MNEWFARFKWRDLAVVIGAVIVLGGLWIPLSQVGTEPAEIRAWLEQTGPLGPLIFFILNVAQVVVAPIPGYPVQVLGGVLFGLVPGSIYTVGGMVVGGTLAAWLGRRLGRPWLEQRLGPETLAEWQSIHTIHSFWTWWIILLIPLGDIPYFFAGLSRIPLWLFALAIFTSRGPFTVLIVWFGDQVVDLPLLWLALAMAGIGVIVLVGYSQKERLERWGKQYIAQAGGGQK